MVKLFQDSGPGIPHGGDVSDRYIDNGHMYGSLTVHHVLFPLHSHEV